jgi:hypothetical protein
LQRKAVRTPYKEKKPTLLPVCYLNNWGWSPTILFFILLYCRCDSCNRKITINRSIPCPLFLNVKSFQKECGIVYEIIRLLIVVLLILKNEFVIGKIIFRRALGAPLFRRFNFHFYQLVPEKEVLNLRTGRNFLVFLNALSTMWL